jgi:hypothetical protein
MSEHTSGEWVARRHPVNKVVFEIWSDNGLIARTVDITPSPIRDDMPANAKLMAAAPKLLAACETAMEWAAGFPLGIASAQADRQAAADVYRRCAAAIARVCGETENNGR